jgi:hypothetical protein
LLAAVTTLALGGSASAANSPDGYGPNDIVGRVETRAAMMAEAAAQVLDLVKEYETTGHISGYVPVCAPHDEAVHERPQEARGRPFGSCGLAWRFWA